jgi:hypothetical protein
VLRIPQLLKSPQGLLYGVCGLAAVVVAGPQQAQAVSISFTSAELGSICPTGTCIYDVFPTAPINYSQLSSTYSPIPALGNYTYSFSNTTLALTFLNAYQALVPVSSYPANNGAVGFGEIPAVPGAGNPGGPLFFTSASVNTVLPGTTLLSTSGQYYTTTASNFTSNQGGTGLLASAPKQNQVWAVYKCISGTCIPVPSPLPILGASAAFGYSRRLRSRLQGSKA